ncbi:ER protein Pkr1-domain-containing protein [Xylariaceae sp. FL0804]|nr:ER protein Pkr1-domain-containing protein [Xylariaceae sp. FL0804]
MASFTEQLWESIFTPGPTPTLLVATNVTFACLQLVLLLLLIATYSVHFVVLSMLSAGLWWAINWFATELKAAQQKEAEEKARADQRANRPGTDDSETEVETIVSRGRPVQGSKGVEAMEQAGEVKLRGEQSSGTKSSASTEDEWEKVSENEKDK